jgi:L-amino acid N-acyltransferase YncA
MAPIYHRNPVSTRGLRRVAAEKRRNNCAGFCFQAQHSIQGPRIGRGCLTLLRNFRSTSTINNETCGRRYSAVRLYKKDDRFMPLRDAEPGDIPAILALYNQAVRETTAAWTSQEETLDERITWFETRQNAGWPVIVATSPEGKLIGFASYGAFRPREGYRKTLEHTVYVDPDFQGQGIGAKLLQQLIDKAQAQEVHVLVGVVDGDNTASIALHKKLGFEIAGRLPEAGTKFGRWLDLVFLTKIVTPGLDSPDV